MCGIIGYSSSDPKKAAPLEIFNALKLMEYRGYDSWGMAYKAQNNLQIVKKIGAVQKVKIKLRASRIGIGHTRWATHGKVSVRNAHPHFDCSKRILVVHNGIIENYKTLKGLIDKGHKIKSETDTEIFAHLIEEELKKGVIDKRNCVKKAFDSLEGNNAVLVYFTEDETLIAIKKKTPLIFTKGTGEVAVASDPYALLKYSNKLYFLLDDEILEVKGGHFQLLDKSGKSKKPNFIDYAIHRRQVGQDDYDHYMLKEIEEQPRVIKNIIEKKTRDVSMIADNIKRAGDIWFVGCGSAAYVGMIGKYIFSKVAGVHANCLVGSEFSNFAKFITSKSLVIAISQSGETMDTLLPIEQAKKNGAKIVSITNVKGSTLFRQSDSNFLLEAGPEFCVLATKSVTAQVAALLLVSYKLAGGESRGKKILNLKRAVKSVENIINNKANVKSVAKSLAKNGDIYVLGRGLYYPVALESALKIKEASYIHAEGFPAGELKHGVISLVEKNTPVIIFNPINETSGDNLSSAYEVKARGARVAGISDRFENVYDEFIEVANCGEATVIPCLVVAQLLSYYIALELNLNPDRPRNLAKSVTVK